MNSFKIYAVLYFAVFIGITAQDKFTITSNSPERGSMNAEINQAITVEFNEPVDVSTISDTSFSVYGRWTGVHNGNISFENENRRLIFQSNKNFNAGEVVTVSFAKTVKSSGGKSLETGYVFYYSIKTKPGIISFEKKSQINVRRRDEGWIQTYGAFAGDLNNDGYTDFTVPNEVSNDVRVFMNDGTGAYSNFVVYPVANGARPSTNEGADFNHDGFMDFAVGNSVSTIVTVFFGDGNGGFSESKNFNVGKGVRGLSVLDLNADGYADIATANRDDSNVSLLLNTGYETFLNGDNINLNTSGETACAATDINNDGITDLFVGSIYGRELVALLGDGNGHLIESGSIEAGGNVWMVGAGDFNMDGFVDAVSANSTSNNFTVAFGDGQGGFIRADIYPAGQFPLAIDAGDIDGDEDLDIVLSNFSSKNYEIYENDGSGNFVKMLTLPTSGAGSCCVLHDRDNDGDLDITGIDEIDDLLNLFDNQIVVTDVNEEGNSPKEFSLLQNYPNPFNPSTKIAYSISTLPVRQAGSPFLPPLAKGRDGVGLFVSLKIFDVLGREIRTLVNEAKAPGTYEVEFNATQLPSGVYFYRLEAGEFTQTKKMVLLR